MTAMGTLVAFRPTVQSIPREGRREIERMYRLSAGGEDPLISAESRELFEPGLIDEVQWQE
jgi:hypothetical protein